MRRSPMHLIALVVTIAFLRPAVAAAQCDPIDFEDLAPGTLVTTQYLGVTFSVAPVPDSCGGSVDLFIGNPAGGTSSGTQALMIETGCPDFSDDYLRMDFDSPQSLVEFTLGEYSVGGIDVEVRAYNGVGTLIDSQLVSPGVGIRTFVRVGSSGGGAVISAIEVEAAASGLEAIDDLAFAMDDTPPIAEIDEPTFLSCACGTIDVVGTTDDPDGGYERDQLHYRPVNADPGDPWVFVGEFTSPLPGGGTLYTLDVSGLAHGAYYLRVTARNACGMESSDVTVVRVDHNAPSINVSSPAPGSTVCGIVEFEGSVRDACMNNWQLQYAPAGSGNWVTIASGNSDEHCVLGAWDTVAGQIPDGLYDIRVLAEDDCGNASSDSFTIEVDNSSGCGSPDINGDGVIDIEDLLILLAAWGPVVP